MPRSVLVGAVWWLLAAGHATAAPPDISGAWTIGRAGARQPGTKALVMIQQTPETVSFAFGVQERAALTVATDGTPRPLAINGAPTAATISARWEGSDLIVELMPGRSGAPPIRNVWRMVDEVTLRVVGGWPLPGKRPAATEIELRRCEPAEADR